MLEHRRPRQPPGRRRERGQRTFDVSGGLSASRDHPEARGPAVVFRDHRFDERERAADRGLQGRTRSRIRRSSPAQIDDAGNFAAFLAPFSPRGSSRRRIRSPSSMRGRSKEASVAARLQRLDERGTDAAAVRQDHPGRDFAAPRRERRRRFPDPLVEPLAGASARLMQQRVLADPLKLHALERRDEFVVGTIEADVRPQDRRARTCSALEDGMGASLRRERRKGAKAAHPDRQIERIWIRVGEQRRQHGLKAAVQKDRVDGVSAIGARVLGERDGARSLARAASSHRARHETPGRTRPLVVRSNS